MANANFYPFLAPKMERQMNLNDLFRSYEYKLLMVRIHIDASKSAYTHGYPPLRFAS
jgi:hypothetical protein